MKYESMEARLLANSVRADFVLPEQDWHLYQHGGTFCWLWTGAQNSTGYGRLCIRMKRGPRKGQPVMQLAHRISLAVFRNRVISGRKVVCHLCNQRLCINPMHLEGGTPRQNSRQCVNQGRHWSGFKGKKPISLLENLTLTGDLL